MVADLTLADVRNEDDGKLYPRESLRGLETALMGFCAAFYGRQDCVWVAEAGLTATCVDTDAEKLFQMAGIYPEQWSFVCDDVYRYARGLYAFGYEYDLVSLDPPTNQFGRCADWIGLWCTLARRLVVLGSGRYSNIDPPAGWTINSVHLRSSFRGGTYWTTLVPV